MKKIILALGIVVLLTSCGQTNKDESINDFVKENPKPIVCYKTKFKHYDDANKHDITLLSANGNIIHIEYTTIILPDTIK